MEGAVVVDPEEGRERGGQQKAHGQTVRQHPRPARQKLGGKFVSDGYVYCEDASDFERVMRELKPEDKEVDMNGQEVL